MPVSLRTEDIRDFVRLTVHEASRAVAPVWPIDSFVALNPLIGLTHLPFFEAVAKGRLLFGSDGYLPEEEYRKWYQLGRITDNDLDEAIRRVKPPLPPKSLICHGEGAESVIRRVLVVADEPVPEAWRVMLGAQLLGQTWEDEGDAWRVIARARLSDDVEHLPNLSHWISRLSGQDLVGRVDRAVIPWLSAFLDEGEASWPMPYRERGFYEAWKTLMGSTKGGRERMHELPENPEEALSGFLMRFGIPESQWSSYLLRHLTQLPGWAGFIKWREEHPTRPQNRRHPITLVEYLAVRLYYEWWAVEPVCRQLFGVPAHVAELVGYFEDYLAEFFIRHMAQGSKRRTHLAKSRPSEAEARRLYESWKKADWDRDLARLYRMARALEISLDEVQQVARPELLRWVDWNRQVSPAIRGAIWQEALEAHAHERLLAMLQKGEDKGPSPEPRTTVVFCMDARSEGIRRHLEALGPYDTGSMAGFFGLPLVLYEESKGSPSHRYPFLATPKMAVMAYPRDVSAHRDVLEGLKALYHRLKDDLFSPFPMVESVGWLAGLSAFIRTVWPELLLRVQDVGTNRGDSRLAIDIPLERQADFVESALRNLENADSWGPLVVWLGHRSQSVNNPWASALHCGAAGGHPSGIHARVLALFANRPAVRAMLARRGLVIPPETWFVGGEHNTTTDRVILYDMNRVPTSHQPLLRRLIEDLETAGHRHAQERARRLITSASYAFASVTGSGDDRSVRQCRRRSVDWAETRPEWGLSGHMALIVGRRALTRQLDLQDRVFLYTYDYRQDVQGRQLFEIFQGPLMVAHHINMAYYFSAVDHLTYGGGSKVRANVVGGIGVMMGSRSDLKPGLPRQSVRDDLGVLYHEPIRLLVVVESPMSVVERILDRQPALQELVTNEWMHLVILDPDTGSWHRYGRETCPRWGARREV